MPDRLSELSRSLTDRVAIVTGAASGMGRATAHVFADEGAKVVVADLGADRVQAVVDEITAVHGADRVLGRVCDVASTDSLRGLVDAAVERFGGIDIVVNNAGVSLINSFLAQEGETDDEFESNWATTLDINLTAHARLVRYAMPHLLESDAARVVNIASTEAIVTTPGLAAYAATKAGVVGLTKSMAVELGRHGITANCICPGPIDTAMTSAIPDEAKETYARRRVPLRRYGVPEEVAQMTVSLCLPAASFLNGAIIPVDGGMSIRHT
ncbi:3-oxoacyl-[acyl-carrier protein] reductase [Ilumatobacter fluminis]|uniref:3-oxoacyl-[acyl-carrier protein] reductase n=1 Tax=Ilumatobacter fluminis TaxID=467091 RepID=A0A4R7HZZ2_9ACTN|nr:SDR family NAD(P)-dependent oxidoreductase [Ilumatobacter fluminis]TDT15753.1 3-oxoacyl-[acyl-carrier protein] reductase [Ilumatobacter fluminis]